MQDQEYRTRIQEKVENTWYSNKDGENTMGVLQVGLMQVDYRGWFDRETTGKRQANHVPILAYSKRESVRAYDGLDYIIEVIR